MELESDVTPSLAELRARIEMVLDQHVRPELHGVGDDIEIVGIDADRIVQVRTHGACQGCTSATIALLMAIEATLKTHIPEIRFLEPVL